LSSWNQQEIGADSYFWQQFWCDKLGISFFSNPGPPFKVATVFFAWKDCISNGESFAFRKTVTKSRGGVEK